MARVSTYLNFDGKTEEAFGFYKTVFGGSFNGPIHRFSQVPLEPGQPPFPAGTENMVMHVELALLGGHVLMGTDAPKEMGFQVSNGNSVHINLEPDTRLEAERLFHALAAGGKIDMPLQDMFWGAYFGSVTDRYGIKWMINCAAPKIKLAQDAPFVIDLDLEAPIDLLWRVYIEPEHLSQWMRPAGFSDAGCTVDLRVGGLYHYGMRTPDGHAMWGKWTFEHLSAPQTQKGVRQARMNAVVSFSDEKQGITRHPMNPDWPEQTYSQMTLSSKGEAARSTHLHFEWHACNANEKEQALFTSSHEDMKQGWGGTLENLKAYLKRLQAD